MVVIDQNNLADAFYAEDLKIILFKTKNILANKNTDKIESLLKSALEFTTEHPVIGEIVDLTHLRGNFTNILKYLLNDYYPIMFDRGMKRAAYIISDDLIALGLVQRICEENKLVETRIFTDLKKAKKWVSIRK